MVRFSQGKSMRWRTDRPAIALCDTFSQDGRLDASGRAAASHARGTVADTVLAHRESDDFEPFDDADYSNAYGPTVHFPVTARQIDAWAPQVSETDNEFYKNVVCGRPDAGDRVTYAHRVWPRADKIVISSCERRRND